jgi:hypothetical protein
VPSAFSDNAIEQIVYTEYAGYPNWVARTLFAFLMKLTICMIYCIRSARIRILTYA